MAQAAAGLHQAAPETASQLRSASEAASSAPTWQLSFTAHRGVGVAARPTTDAATAVEVLLCLSI